MRQQQNTKNSFVHPQHRGCKICEALIDIIKNQAKKLGQDILYLLAFDPTIPAWHALLG